ncbi:hypothetical protein [Symmachiella dynata]|uniref:hypothetical protein n=1 Tax=Symmachiella dynata TaxID=2527995 RepID=UPI0018D2AA2D|nr:hypothetical protein [Symmachiella dynata]
MLYIFIAVVVSVGPHFRHWYTGKRSAPCCAERFLFLCAEKALSENHEPDGLLIDPDLSILRFQRGKFARSRVLKTSRFSGSIILSSKAADDHRISL